MKNNMKKLLSLVLVFVMVLSLGLVSVNADGELSVKITTPGNGSVILPGAAVSVTAEAVGAEYVEFSLDGAVVATVDAAPYTYIIESMKDGELQITATAVSGDLRVSDSVVIASGDYLMYAGFEDYSNNYGGSGSGVREIVSAEEGETGKYMRLGANAYGDSPYVEFLPQDLTGLSGQVAVEARVKFTSTANDARLQIINTSGVKNDSIVFYTDGMIYFGGNSRPTGYAYETDKWYKLTFVIDYDANKYYFYMNDNKVWTWKSGGLNDPSIFTDLAVVRLRPAFADTSSSVYVDYMSIYNWTEPNPDVLLDETFAAIDGIRTNTDYLGRFTAIAGSNGTVAAAPSETGMTGKALTVSSGGSTIIYYQFEPIKAKKFSYSYDFYTTAPAESSKFNMLQFQRQYTGGKDEGYSLLMFENGVIKYHNGSAYANSDVSWTENTLYHVEFEIDTVNLTFSIYITGGDFTERTALTEGASIAAFADKGLSGLKFGIYTQPMTPSGITYYDNYLLKKTVYEDLGGVMFEAGSGKIKTSASKAPANPKRIIVSFKDNGEALGTSENVKLYQGDTEIPSTGEYDLLTKSYSLVPATSLATDTEYRLVVNGAFGENEVVFTTGGDDFSISEVTWNTDDSTVSANVTVSSSEYTLVARPVAVILCTYDGTKLRDIYVREVNVAIGGSEEISGSVDYTSGDKAMVYIWDSVYGMQPMCGYKVMGE